MGANIATELGLASNIHEGVYTMVGGPNFETPAELRMFKTCGIDAVGKFIYYCIELE